MTYSAYPMSSYPNTSRGSSGKWLLYFRSHFFTVNPRDKEIGLCVKLWERMFSFLKHPISLMF